MGCRGCQVACKQWNNLPAVKTEFFAGNGGYQNPPDLTADTYSLVTFTEVGNGAGLKWVFSKRQCMHCLEPACVAVCPVQALEISEAGAVVYHEEKCIGCRSCSMACPFGVPTYDWSGSIPSIRKCAFCNDRMDGVILDDQLNASAISDQEKQSFDASFTTPSCAKTCPTGATMYGDRDALIADAKSRIQASPGKYIDHIYGEHEAGGTRWMYISAVPFEELGFPSSATLGNRPDPVMIRASFGAVPVIVIAGGAVLGGLHWLHQRKLENANGDQPEGAKD
jgi:formate dehydrogenase iron-sulfur subunit